MTDPDRRTPSWHALEQARKLLAPPPLDLASLSDDDLLAQWAVAKYAAGQIGQRPPQADPQHEAEVTALQARLRRATDAELLQMRRATLDLLFGGPRR